MASAGSSLARDLSIRSENVTSNRVLSGRPRSRDATKSARLATGKILIYFAFTSMFNLIVKIRIIFCNVIIIESTIHDNSNNFLTDFCQFFIYLLKNRSQG